MTLRKIIIVLLFICNPILIYAQISLEKELIVKNEYKLYYRFANDKLIVTSKNGKTILNYDGFEDPTKPGEIAFPSFDVFISIPYGTYPEVSLAPEEIISYNAFPELNPSVSIVNSQLKYENGLYLKNSPSPQTYSRMGFLWLGEDYCLHLKLNLFDIKRDEIKISVIKKFAIILKFDSEIIEAKSITSINHNPLILNRYSIENHELGLLSNIKNTDSWIDYNQEYLKIGTNKDGIYRIRLNDLILSGINVSLINPMTFKLYLKGSEIPIYVAGENDNKFDETDYIEFVGLRNMGGKYREISESDVPYKEYINRYSDTTVYWLTWNGRAGLRAISQQKQNATTSDTLKYYSEVIHIENNNWFDFSMQDAIQRELPYWAENKTWHEGNLGVGTRNINFTPKDFYPNGQVKIFTKLQDYASSISNNAHLLAISLNSSAKQDSGFINKYQQKVLQGTFNSNLLKVGNNTLNVYSFATLANPNLCIVDWYEVEYPRYVKAINDSLNFQFSFLLSSSVQTISLANLNPSKRYSVWKIGNNYEKYSLNISGNNGEIVDTIRKDDHFFLTDSTRVLRPTIYYKKMFVNLRSQSNTSDYIAITHKKFLKNVSDYANFISNNYNVKCKLVDVGDIYDEFAYGFFSPESIRDFLITANKNWQKPSPSYVFLIGGATYDYLGNKAKYQGAPSVINYVPSFGSPVSDNWFVIWDTTGAYIPQMNIGRLPITSNEEFLWYFQKHQQYVSQKNTAWNKRFLFFSGGTGNDQNQLDQLRNTNNFIINNYIVPLPIGGNYTHFFKTTNPVSNFGSYSPPKFQSVIDSGSVFISYLGHSGTQTWDNSITDPGQLKNSINRYPLITDFGCSTAKFAEPDVTSFSQLFVNNLMGQAIGYIGNSSLGFTSTSYSFPQVFYKKILIDSVFTIGEAHRLAKLDLIKNFGSSGAVKLFALTNTLIGDPIVKLSIPTKINLVITRDNVKYLSKTSTDSDDSLRIRIKYFNFGLAQKDTFSLSVTSHYNKTISYGKISLKQLPLYADSFDVSIPIKKMPGEHTVVIKLDTNNRLNELSKDDNQIDFSFYVTSSSMKTTSKYYVESKQSNPISLINPVSDPSSKTFQVELSLNSSFRDFTRLEYDFDMLKTKISLPDQFLNKRVWMRSRINSFSDYSTVVSFTSGGVENCYSLSDSISINIVEKNKLKVASDGLSLDKQTISIKSLSAGFNDGNTALIQVNNQNLIPENSLGGHHIVVLEDSTYKFVQYKRFFILGDAVAEQNYINFLDTLSQKYLVVIAVSDEGSVSSMTLRNKLKQFGSKYVDSLGFRGSWTMIGKRGVKPGTVPEKYSKPFKGRVQTDTTISTKYDNGNFTTTKIGPAINWKRMTVKDSFSIGSYINYRILGIKKDESIDTLNNLQVKNHVADLSLVDAKKYSYIKINGQISLKSKSGYAYLKNLEINYTNAPELGINYQVVSISKDSLEQGEKENLNFSVYNVGESTASNFKVRVDLVKNDNSKEKLLEQVIDSIQTEKKKDFSLSYTTDKITGGNQFQITIDPDNSITELYKDNNFYSVPFYIKPNNKPASLKLTIDGNDILNGDFISSKPNFKIELNDESLIPITDTSKVLLYLNNKRIYFSSNAGILNYNYSSSNPKMVVNYTPTLADGDYTFKVVGKNATDQIIDSTGIVRKFTVKKELQLLNAYNYPNPFTDETHFTFKLTQIPDELRIIIYTIAGRKIKEIKLSAAELKYDFNRIFWDGRDQDGDLAANGVYLYKIISQKGSEKTELTEKLVIIR